MSPADLARGHFLASAATQHELADSAAVGIIVESARALSRAVAAGGKILLCGNGGSAADAQHIAAEFTCRLRASMSRPGIPAIALTTDTSFLTACANDFGFESVFERLIDALGQSGDALIAISTSGESQNVIRAVSRARSKGILTVGFLGGSGGWLASLVDLAIVVPTQATAHIQESHIAIGHILCELVEEMLYGAYSSAGAGSC
jgi:D-sedoheptulose 7-phosphate isomerase